MIIRIVKIVLGILLAGCLLCGLFVLSVINGGKEKIYARISDVQDPQVVIVFGAGLTAKGEPSDALFDRLQTAADIYHAGKATHILVSGDNRFPNYNEPQAMLESLTQTFNVPTEKIAVDYAGRRTYDTCARARELWNIHRAILVTQGFHLYRAIWTCEHLGIQSVGLSASLRSYIKDKAFKIREIGAMLKAYIDVYIVTPDYLKGDVQQDLSAL
jgi:vancomycin permeability regulator SanA